ncbi:unnamed protein product, partial [Cylicostephanus goldi]
MLRFFGKLYVIVTSSCVAKPESRINNRILLFPRINAIQFRWAFGVLLFEIITLGGSPYPLTPPEDMLQYLEGGGRMERPDNCPENLWVLAVYEVMVECWKLDPEERPNFLTIRQKLA